MESVCFIYLNRVNTSLKNIYHVKVDSQSSEKLKKEKPLNTHSNKLQVNNALRLCTLTFGAQQLNCGFRCMYVLTK